MSQVSSTSPPWPRWALPAVGLTLVAAVAGVVTFVVWLKNAGGRAEPRPAPAAERAKAPAPPPEVPVDRRAAQAVGRDPAPKPPPAPAKPPESVMTLVGGLTA